MKGVLSWSVCWTCQFLCLHHPASWAGSLFVRVSDLKQQDRWGKGPSLLAETHTVHLVVMVDHCCLVKARFLTRKLNCSLLVMVRSALFNNISLNIVKRKHFFSRNPAPWQWRSAALYNTYVQFQQGSPLGISITPCLVKNALLNRLQQSISAKAVVGKPFLSYHHGTNHAPSPLSSS